MTRQRLLAGCLEFLLVAGCSSGNSPPVEAKASRTAFLVGDSRVEGGEQCDDGNSVGGDGCAADGRIEAGFLCHRSGQRCSAASACGNGQLETGETCDDGNKADNGNGCSADCGLSLCGNGRLDNRAYPNYDQEICDDGNVFDGDGCDRLCQVEPGWACSGNPARCVRAGIALFNTGVDENNRRLADGALDQHWKYSNNNLGAQTSGRIASDWPQESPSARIMKQGAGVDGCVYQDFMLPAGLDLAKFHISIATFNDDGFDRLSVNGTRVSSTTVSEPAGQPWQKNIIREVPNTAPWRIGLNRLEVCNVNVAGNVPNGFRYMLADAYDGRCGDGVIAEREECDDANLRAGDGCDPTCGVEPTYVCTGAPSSCLQLCGNGALNPGEECDDRNTQAGDGCDSRCRVERGAACPTAGQPCIRTCGNGAVDPGEPCDDGNAFAGDGCTPACRIERGWECFGAPSTCSRTCGNGQLQGSEQCDDGNVNTGDGCSVACTLELTFACPTPGAACVRTCGNGRTDTGEECDDGNLNPGDGCRSDCRVERGFACSASSTAASVCASTCGNGAVDANEQCDDRNAVPGDGCSAGCRVESGFSCPSGANCVPRCGDGIIVANEVCDDTTTPGAAGNGCSATCTVERGWVCPAPGVTCNNTCGNGSLDVGEGCDDSNTVDGDGCSGICKIEPGFHCSGRPSACSTTCGDGVRAGGEICDDGNLAGGDGCSSNCRRDDGAACTTTPQCDGVCNPRSMLCAAAFACGNGVLETGESCDDGNTAAGDGCSGCKREVGQACQLTAQCQGVCNPASSLCAAADTCGNGVLEGVEKCDDGNSQAGDGCSAACLREDGQGCTTSAQCVGLCNPTSGRCAPVNVCGNGVKEGSELCDDGNTSNADTCSSTCLFGLHQACATSAQCASGACNPTNNACAPSGVCGNGILDPGEACDSSTDCTPQCRRTPGGPCHATAECATGYVCNTGAPTGGAPGSCFPADFCGNGVREAGEVCDDGNTTDSDACAGSCRAAFGQPCTLNVECIASLCALGRCVVPQTCGNGVLEATEVCDDGNVIDGDGCTSTCVAEPNGACRVTADCVPGFLCSPASRTCLKVGACGNGVVETGEPCDDGNMAVGDGCTAACRRESGQPCATSAQCTGVCNPATARCAPAMQCGNGVREGTEKCDDGNTAAGDGCSATCVKEDGARCATSAECTGVCNPGRGVCAPANTCNNGVLEAAELCDDGTSSDFDGCTTRCLRSVGEACTAAAQCDTMVCNSSTMRCDRAGVCGNTALETGEICDSPVDCDNTCHRPLGAPCDATVECTAGVCNHGSAPPSPATQAGRCFPAALCGNGVREADEVCDDGNGNELDGCTGFCRFSVGAACTRNDECITQLCNPRGVCVVPQVCGNAVVEGTEGCDDGNTVSGDGCTGFCVAEDAGPCGGSGDCLPGLICNPLRGQCAPGNACGNGLLEGGESCDDGNVVTGDGCDPTCRLELGALCSASGTCAGVCNPVSGRCAAAMACGNGVVETGEACDDGNTASSDGCDAACKLELGRACVADADCEAVCNPVSRLCARAGVCGNGKLEGNESCDDGDQAAGDGCDPRCLREAGAACASSTECAGLCVNLVCVTAAICGNGVVEGIEVCDDGNQSDTDACTRACRKAEGQACALSTECDGLCNPATRACAPAGVCGNGLPEGEEVCDDGNGEDGDQCLNTCTLPAPVGGGCGCGATPAEALFPQLLGLLALASLRRRSRDHRGG